MVWIYSFINVIDNDSNCIYNWGGFVKIMINIEKKSLNMKYILVFAYLILLLIGILLNINYVNAQGLTNTERIGTSEATVCCEKTNSGLFCQDVREEDCKSERQTKTSCESTSFCKGGFCFDSVEGTCLDNVPQIVCNENGGTWSEEKPAQCNLGCCLLNDQASFSTLVRCKRLSAFYGLETNYNAEIKDEAQCIISAGLKEKGACVFTQDFDKTCKITTKEGCTSDLIGTAPNVLPVDRSQDSGLVPSVTNKNTEVVSAEGTEIISNPEEIKTSPADNTQVEENVKFFPGKLCSAEDLGTNCGPTKQTTCIPGKDEVYFVDTCGNIANVYDSTKVNNKNYWDKIIDKKDSCDPNSGNENDQNCGNCNYLYGSYCRAIISSEVKPKIGTNICKSLNCKDENGVKILHGESWCAYDVKGYDFSPKESIAKNYIETEIIEALNKKVSASASSLTKGNGLGKAFLAGASGPVGSKFYRKICINGEIKTEPCADFRQEECIENTMDTPAGKFSEAACRVNRWQDCTAQRKITDCLNTDRRDCTWLAGIEYILMGALMNGSSLDTNSLAGVKERVGAEIDSQGGKENIPKGACVPKNPPGLKFWQGEEAKTVCAQANALCPVTYTKGLTGDWECKDNCVCDPDENPAIVAQRAQVCMALGDCGPKINYLGDIGYKKGYEVKKKKINKEKD